jgi:hypothetical protein
MPRKSTLSELIMFGFAEVFDVVICRALECFVKCLNFAPSSWTSRPVVLGNKAATYVMLDR